MHLVDSVFLALPGGGSRCVYTYVCQQAIASVLQASRPRRWPKNRVQDVLYRREGSPVACGKQLVEGEWSTTHIWAFHPPVMDRMRVAHFP